MVSNRIRDYLPPPSNWFPVLLGMLGLGGLYAVSRHNFLLFHCLAEAFSIVIAIAVFAIFWNTRRLLANGLFLVIGFGCLFAGLFDLIYIFAYPEMSVFPGADGNLALQGKTVAQWFVSLSCLSAILLIRRKIHQDLALSLYSVLAALALGCIFYWRVFPACYVEGMGQTVFQRIGLVISCIAYLATLGLLIRNRREFDSYVFQLLTVTLIVFFVEDFASAVATDLNGSAKAVAHLCQVVSLFCVYKAFVEVGLTKPYDLLFRSLQQSAEALARSVSMLRATLESTADGILVVDLEGRFVEFNQKFAAAWQITQDLIEVSREGDPLTSNRAREMMQSVLGQLKDPGAFLAKVAELYTQPEVSSFDVLEFKDGRTFERYSLPQRIAGKPVGRVWSFRDVTDRKRMEESLRESRDQLARLADNLPHSIVFQFLPEPNHRRFTYFSAAAQRILGISPEEAIADAGALFCRILEPFQPVVKQAQAKAARDHSTFDVEAPVRAADDTVKWLHFCATPCQREDGQTVWDGIATDITERKQAAEALRQSEEGLRLVLEASGIGGWRVDLVSGNVMADDRCKELLGLPLTTEPTFALFLERILPADRPLAERHFAEALACPGDYQGEYRTTWPDGSLHHLFIKGRSYHDPSGKARHMDGIAMDITDRKRAEEKVLASEASLLEAQRIASLGSYVLDILQGRWTGSDVLEQIFDIPSNFAMTVEGWGNIVHPNERQAMLEYFRNDVLGKHEPFDREYRIVRHGDNQVRWVHGLGRLQFDAAGYPTSMVGTIQDITDRKRADEALRASEERYRLFVETIPQLAWRLSPDGLDIDCNRRWYEYTGQTPAQVRAHGWLAVVHPDDLFEVFEQALHAANTKEPYELEYRLRRASDGSYRWHLARAVPVLGEDGQVTCWVGSNTDIEELKQAQEVLKQAHDEQLQQHRAELAHVARLSMMGEMAASLAHELNQPLHAVKNYAYGSICRLEKMPERDEEFVVALEQIGDEANRAAEIIRRVMAFVQKREPRFSEVAVNGLVEEAVLFSKTELGRRRAKIVLELAADLPAVVGDAIQIEQVIMNLVRNGLEAMDETPNDDRLLNIKTMRHSDEMVLVEISDRGKGIGKENLTNVFEPFFTTKPEGMGMGLAISRSIVHAHRGRIWASANQDQGCTFYFTLPVGKRS